MKPTQHATPIKPNIKTLSIDLLLQSHNYTTEEKRKELNTRPKQDLTNYIIFITHI